MTAGEGGGTARRLGIWLRWVVVALTLAAAAPAAAAGPTYFSLSAGAFDVANSDPLAEAGLELRLAPRRYGLAPTLGLMVNSARGGCVYGGVSRAFELGTGWFLAPGFAIGLYGAGDDGEGVALGGTVEFRSVLELAREVRPGTRLGLAFYHLSNGGLYGLNPGSNSLVLTLGFAPGRAAAPPAVGER